MKVQLNDKVEGLIKIQRNIGYCVLL